MRLDLGANIAKGPRHDMAQLPPLVREHGSAGLSDELFAPPVAFKLPDLIADGRGADAQLVCRILEAQPLVRDFEGPQRRQWQLLENLLRVAILPWIQLSSFIGSGQIICRDRSAPQL